MSTIARSTNSQVMLERISFCHCAACAQSRECGHKLLALARWLKRAHMRQVTAKGQEGVILACGNIEYAGQQYATPQSFARACGASPHMCSWRFVMYGEKSLADIRDEYEKNAAAAAVPEV
jgi:hypothetical protein